MTDQTTGLSLYEEMVSRGIDMGWYEKRKHPKASGNIPLDDKVCSRNSIYLLKQDRSLWTVRSNGEAFAQVRQTGKQQPRDVYVCLCCKEQWRAMPAQHGEGHV